MSQVNIKIADQGWVLESLARDIGDMSRDISVSTQSDSCSTLQYYVNYSCWNGRQSEIEVGFFTHIETDPLARLNFFRVAENMDHCVCMSERYAEELHRHGIENVSIIAPGIDFSHFCPKIRIGVVGRAYHTGRKGENIVREVMDIEAIEWIFTGSGWPGVSCHLSYEEMPAFYNSVDYILVPSLFEGGPMSVIEGLACGKEIIASDVGWVRDFPHIPFETGNPNSLRQVLEGLIAKRQVLRRSVKAQTKEAWAEGHLSLFDKLLGKELDREISRKDREISRQYAVQPER